MNGNADSNTAHLSDERLLELYSSGSADGFAELFRRYRTLAYRVAYRLLNHEADALDAVQESFINVLRNARHFRGQSSFKTWFLRVVANAAVDLGRQRQRHTKWIERPTDQAEPAVEDFQPMQGLEHADLLFRLNEALAKLPQAQRETFVLHVDAELSYREVAETLNISVGTVMSRLFYARQRLKEFLADQVLT